MVGAVSADSQYLCSVPPSVVGSICPLCDDSATGPHSVGTGQTVFYEQASYGEIHFA